MARELDAKQSGEVPGTGVVGRGARDGARLFRDWFERLTTAGERGEQAAYVFVMGSMCEVLRCFDFHVVFPEINALQTAVRKVSQDYLSTAEDYGYSPDVCAYVRADVGMQLRGGSHPMARIPKPALTVATNACNTYIKWSEIWTRLYGTPMFTLDVPDPRSYDHPNKPDKEEFETDRRYVEHQIRELIELCERITGKRFDIDRLREAMGHASVMADCYRRALAANRAQPAVFNALGDGTIYLGVVNALRGTPEGSNYFRELVDELEYKAAHGIGSVEGEQYRLVFTEVPCYPIFRPFNELFTRHGGVFVGSSYLHIASGGESVGFQYDLKRPIESLAEGTLLSVGYAMDQMFYSDRHLLGMVDSLHADAVVYHAVKSCRTGSSGMADSRRLVMEKRDIPCLYIESDLVDPRVVSQAQLRNRVDAFFENLASRKLHASLAG
jgi:benzoyl-CoA reductase subunit B